MARIPAPLLFTLALLSAVTLVGCQAGQRKVTMRNDTTRPVNVRLVHDTFMDGDQTLATARLDPGDEQTMGPYRLPQLEPITLEASFSSGIGDLPQTYRINRPDVRLVFESGGVESWSGFIITRESDAETEGGQD